ncbi:MAG: trypsin-like peptidase domain-containing protein [Thaumarchaeota archaeon]|nr:trypsin-like peptidase domain-containing protein [Nitrososphaerota archaeon]
MEPIELQDKITDAVETLAESVVSIDSIRMARDFRFGVIPVEGQGSGVIIDTRGYLVTNNHVVDDATRVQVHLQDGRSIVGEVVGTDPATDVAIVRVQADNLPSAALGDSENLRVGQIALAIGNALGLPGAPTVSMGVVSALGRPLPGTDFVLEGMIQTDAAINPGNSGGPLADLNGRVIGINTAVVAFAQGVGFAIPIDTVKRVVDQLFKHGRVIRPWLGISGTDVTPALARRYGLKADSGVLLVDIARDSPAFEAGFRPGDIISRVSSHPIATMKDLLRELSKALVGDALGVEANREGRLYQSSVRLVEVPASLFQRRGQ